MYVENTIGTKSVKSSQEMCTKLHNVFYYFIPSRFKTAMSYNDWDRHVN